MQFFPGIFRLFLCLPYRFRKRILFSTILLAASASLPVRGPAAFAQATAYQNAPPLLLGASWYPEQWDEARWDEDLRLMEAANIHLTRLGEFAWSSLEPSEGHYELDWLERAIQKAAEHHIVVMLSTPTAGPPAWLTSKYPETLRMDEDGKRAEHGSRQQFSFASQRYRELARGIAEQLAMRFGHNPNVVGWQIDNEYMTPSFDAEARQQFHAWLAKKYGSIQNLNKHWTTAYWSQTYDNFDQIPVHANGENPGLMIEWKRFVSDTWKSYSQNQIDAIRPHADPRQFITTNTMGWWDGYDHSISIDLYTLHSNLDIAGWDNYVGGHYDPPANATGHDLTRGFKHKNYWVLETQPVINVNEGNNSPLDRGRMREMAWQAVGHGADAVEYWQWRSALNGQEQYHGTIVGPDGAPLPAYDEIKEIGAEFEKTGAALAGTSPHAEVAIVQSYDSRWAMDLQPVGRFNVVSELIRYYRPLSRLAQTVDIVSPDAPLSQYKLVEAPALNVLPQSVADRLTEYVEQGGNLLLGPRSGMKDEYSALNVQRQPGPLVPLLGGRVEQYYMPFDPVPVSGELGSGTAQDWAETLSAKDPSTHVLMRYGKSNGWLDDQPAILTRQVGKGSITYSGARLDDALLQKLTAYLVTRSGVQPVLDGVPEGVEVCRRASAQRSLLIVINHNNTPQHVELHGSMRDLLTGTGPLSAVDLPKYGVAVLEKSAE